MITELVESTPGPMQWTKRGRGAVGSEFFRSVPGSGRPGQKWALVPEPGPDRNQLGICELSTVNEHQILFSAEMVRAILDGRKGQTRRIVKPSPGSFSHASFCGDHFKCGLMGSKHIRCPYGVPGDHLRMLCSWAVHKDFDELKPTALPNTALVWSHFREFPKPDDFGKYRPGRFIPKFLRYRMPLAENTGVRVERLQDISEADAIAEGIATHSDAKYWDPSRKINIGPCVHEFMRLWDTINGKRAPWASNPWVWVVEFKRVQP